MLVPAVFIVFTNMNLCLWEMITINIRLLGPYPPFTTIRSTATCVVHFDKHLPTRMLIQQIRQDQPRLLQEVAKVRSMIHFC